MFVNSDPYKIRLVWQMSYLLNHTLYMFNNKIIFYLFIYKRDTPLWGGMTLEFLLSWNWIATKAGEVGDRKPRRKSGAWRATKREKAREVGEPRATKKKESHAPRVLVVPLRLSVDFSIIYDRRQKPCAVLFSVLSLSFFWLAVF